MSISDEAVEAAAEGFYTSGAEGNSLNWEDLSASRKAYFLRRARIALESAAPHLRAEEAK